MLSFPLERDGYSVILAADGEEALRRFDESPVDLVVLDIMRASQFAADPGDGGLLDGQLPEVRQRSAEFGLRLRGLASFPQDHPDVQVMARQRLSKLGNGGVVVGQLLVDRQRLAEFGLRFR